MHHILYFISWVGVFLVFLSATKFIETLFLVIDSMVKGTRFETTLRDKIVTWVAISYLLTAFAYLVS